MDELVNGKKFNCRHTEMLQVIDDRRVRESGILPLQFGRDIGMPDSEALDMDLVDHRFMEGYAKSPIISPIEGRIDDDRLRHKGGTVILVGWSPGFVKGVRKDCLIPIDPSFDCFRIRIEQQLCRIAPVPLFGPPWTVDAKAVTLPGAYFREIAVPAEGSNFRKIDRGLVPLFVKEAEFNLFSHLRRN
jgi:hypothetical protein